MEIRELIRFMLKIVKYMDWSRRRSLLLESLKNTLLPHLAECVIHKIDLYEYEIARNRFFPRTIASSRFIGQASLNLKL
jgi:hypothetical protein